MPSLTFSAELMREHREIDTAISTIAERLYYGSVQHELLTEHANRCGGTSTSKRRSCFRRFRMRA